MNSFPNSPATLPGAFPLTVRKPAPGPSRLQTEDSPLPARVASSARPAVLRRQFDSPLVGDDNLPGKWNESMIQPSALELRLPNRTPPGELLDQPSHLVLDDPFAGEDLSDVEPDRSEAEYPQDVESGADISDASGAGDHAEWEGDLGRVAASSTETLAPGDDEKRAVTTEPSFGFTHPNPWVSPRTAGPRAPVRTPAAAAARLARLQMLQTPPSRNRGQLPIPLGTPSSALSGRTPRAAETKINEDVKELMQKQVSDLRDFADHEIHFRDEMITQLQVDIFFP